jgi:hypothetical protein
VPELRRIASLQVETVLGGTYAGLLLSMLSAYYSPDLTQKTVSALGTVLAPLTAVFVGIGIYMFYRVILGECLLYPARHSLHWLIDEVCRKWRGEPDGFISFTALLASEGVPFGLRRYIYSELRNSADIFADGQRQRFDMTHATYHFLYITAVEFGVAAWYRRKAPDWGLLAAVAAAALVAVFIADIRQDSWECWLLRQKRTEVKNLVQKFGFTAKTSNPPR